jgi:hypothetical protein
MCAAFGMLGLNRQASRPRFIEGQALPPVTMDEVVPSMQRHR